jgi:hypothetical protein
MAKTKITVTVYPDKVGAWRWRRRVGNGKVSAASAESFDSKGNGMRAGRRERALYDPARFDVELVVGEG